MKPEVADAPMWPPSLKNASRLVDRKKVADLIGVDHQVLGPAVVGLVHEAPLQAGGKSGSSTTSQAFQQKDYC